MMLALNPPKESQALPLSSAPMTFHVYFPYTVGMFIIVLNFFVSNLACELLEYINYVLGNFESPIQRALTNLSRHAQVCQFKEMNI